MICSSCKRDVIITNKHFKLCLVCNNDRLANKKPKKFQNKKNLDEVFYEKCFYASNHKCEECGKSLPSFFRNEDGFVIAKYRYSHIIPKSIAPELRYDINNINHLCLNCHSDWENGDKIRMKIYDKNNKKFPQYFLKKRLF